MDLNYVEELVIKAKKGDMKAKEEILESFRPFIFNLTKKTFIYGYDHFDINNECYTYLLGAIEKYDVSKHRFVSYATNSIKNNLCVLLQRSLRRSNSEGSKKLSFDEIIDSMLDFDSTPELQFIEKDTIKALNRAIKQLNEDELYLYKYLYIDKKSIKSFSDLQSLSYSKAYKMKNDLLYKLNKLMHAY